MLRSLGLDAKDANRRQRAKAKQLDDLVGAHSGILKRRKWRESVYEQAIKKAGAAGVLHLDDAGRLRLGLSAEADPAQWLESQARFAANLGKASSKGYASKVREVFGGAAYAEAHAAMKRMLRHRDGTNREDLYAVDVTTGAVLDSVTTSDRPFGVAPTKRMRERMAEAVAAGNRVATIHNHPGSGFPSAEDMASLAKSGADFGVIACHDGSIYVYRIVGSPQPGYNISQDSLDDIASRWGSKGEKALFEAIRDWLGVQVEHFV